MNTGFGRLIFTSCFALNPAIGTAAPANSAIPMLSVADAPAICEAMKGRQIGVASILNAELATTSGTEAKYCKVSALIGKALNFEVHMPQEWNRRLLYIGGGGWDGSISMSLARTPPAEFAGYVRVASDGGHQGSFIDASWAINNPKAQIDFAYLSVHTVLQATNPIVHAYYSEVPRFRYFEGCSNGGREGLISATRFPEDFDGIIAGAPEYNWTALLRAFGRNAQRQAGTPLNPAQSRAIDQAVMSQCDKRDGVADGIVSNPAACNFDPGTLQCGKSAAPGECLTEAQVATARTFYSEVRSRNGARVYPAFWPGGESEGWPFWLTGGGSMMPGDAVSPIGAQHTFYEGMVKYWLMADPSYEVWKFDFDEQAPAVRQAGLMLNAGSDLTAFFALGHKLILWHGASDWAISAQDSVDYFDAIAQSVGGASKRDESMEFYLAPSVQHCFGGSGADTFSFTEPLTAWVERGTRPRATRQVARKLDAEGKTLFTRPLCAYPARLKYKGKGNVADAASFECAQP